MEMLSLNLLVPSLILVAGFVLVLLDFIPRRLFIRSVKNKHVFVTGASSGIGLAIAKKALRQGANVTLVSRSKANLITAADSLASDVHCSPETIRCEVADVGDYEAISSAIEKSSRWKPIDILICNAGLTRGGYLSDASIQDMDVTVRTNFMGVVNALHAALPELKQRSRNHPISIVIMGSLASMFVMYGHSVYTATKYALRGLAEGLRFELLPYNIKVSLICPGFTDTPFLDEADKERDISDLLKWVNFYSRRFAESPDSVARHTMTAIRMGSFLVTTNLLGMAVATLGRGFVPADSLVKWVMEVILFFPVRVASVLFINVFGSIIRRKCNNFSPHTKSEAQES